MSGTKGMFKKVAITACLGISLSVGTAYAEKSMETVYHVYLNEEPIGTVQSKQVVKSYIHTQINRKENLYGEWDFVINDKIDYKKERVFSPDYKKENVLTHLDQDLSVAVEAVGLQVDGHTIAYLPSKEKAVDVIEKYKQQYIKPEILQSLKKGEKPDIGMNESEIIDVALSETMTFETREVKPAQVSSVKEVVEAIDEGKTLIDHQRSPRVSKKTPISVESQDSSEERSVDVVATKKGIRSEAIPHEDKIVLTDELLKGETKIKREGKDGEKVIHYTETLVNGKVTDKEIIKEQTASEPVTSIILKGTKVLPHVGTGDFLWPAHGGTITSYQGKRWGDYHKGIDIAGVSNREIRAADNGTVITAEYQSGFGNKVVIDHNNGYKTIYAHLSSIDVEVGETVTRGSQVGIMGTTGNSTGIHLHFEVYKNGELQNPMSYF